MRRYKIKSNFSYQSITTAIQIIGLFRKKEWPDPKTQMGDLIWNWLYIHFTGYPSNVNYFIIILLLYNRIYSLSNSEDFQIHFAELKYCSWINPNPLSKFSSQLRPEQRIIRDWKIAQFPLSLYFLKKSFTVLFCFLIWRWTCCLNCSHNCVKEPHECPSISKIRETLLY